MLYTYPTLKQDYLCTAVLQKLFNIRAKIAIPMIPRLVPRAILLSLRTGT